MKFNCIYFSFLHAQSFFIRNLFIRIPRLKNAKKIKITRNYGSHAAGPKNSTHKDFLQGNTVLFPPFFKWDLRPK